jgi:hypothetical protein
VSSPNRIDRIDLIRRWCAAHHHVVLWDEPSATLFDVFAGRALKIDPAALAEAAEKIARDTGEAYVVMLFSDGRQLALSSTGIAWPPDPRNLPHALALPPVVCWRDFQNVAGRVQHVLESHPDERPSREVLDMLLYCIALLDGARAVGFDTAADERRIEGYLERIE